MSFKLLSASTGKEYVLKDNSRHIKPNPFAKNIDSLYLQPDSGELYYPMPSILFPKLFIIKDSKNDTVFLKYDLASDKFNEKSIFDYFKESDSTLFNNTKHIIFNVAINWDGEIYFVKAQDIVGSFNIKQWILAWNKIRAIPYREGGFQNEYRFLLPLNIK